MATRQRPASVCRHDRAKSDEEMKAIAGTDGLIGVYAVPFCLAAPAKMASVDTMLDHIDYIANLVGRRHVAIGTDWPFRLSHGIRIRQMLAGDRGARDFVNFTRGLVVRGYSDQAVLGILGDTSCAC